MKELFIDTLTSLKRVLRPTPLSPVEFQLRGLIWRTSCRRMDDCEITLAKWLKIAEAAKHLDQKYVDAASDIACCEHPEGVQMEVQKFKEWQIRQEKALSINRPPRHITMKLFPKYFALILSGLKTYEGRAFDPESDKDYADIRHGDSLIFTISQEVDGWQDACAMYSLDPNATMTASIGQVVFGLGVHDVFQLTRRTGHDFQPQIYGDSPATYLERIAAYYDIPNYPLRIGGYNFIGLEVIKPTLV